MWTEISLDGSADRLACWEKLLADDELATLIGKSDAGKGKAMLASMKAVKALDINGDGQIVVDEFNRLYDSSVLAAAEL